LENSKIIKCMEKAFILRLEAINMKEIFMMEKGREEAFKFKQMERNKTENLKAVK